MKRFFLAVMMLASVAEAATNLPSLAVRTVMWNTNTAALLPGPRIDTNNLTVGLLSLVMAGGSATNASLLVLSGTNLVGQVTLDPDDFSYVGGLLSIIGGTNFTLLTLGDGEYAGPRALHTEHFEWNVAADRFELASNIVAGAEAGVTALQPTGDGSGLTGITSNSIDSATDAAYRAGPSSGTLTNVAAGTWLTGGGAGPDVPISVNTNAVMAAVDGRGFLTAEAQTLQDVVNMDATAVTNVPGLTMAEGARVDGRMFGPSAGTDQGTDYTAFGEYAAYNASGSYFSAHGTEAGTTAIGDFWSAHGRRTAIGSLSTNSWYGGQYAGRTARGNNRGYWDVYAANPVYPADGATNDTIFLDNTGILYLGGGTMRAENPSAGVVLRGPVTLAGSVTLNGDEITEWPTGTGGATNITAGAADSYDYATRTLTWNTNAVPTSTGGGISEATATNIAREVAFGAVIPYALASSTNVVIDRLVGTNRYRLVLTHHPATLTIATNSWLADEDAFFTLTVNRGTNTLGYSTLSITNATLIDVPASTLKRLVFSKLPGELWWRVRE